MVIPTKKLKSGFEMSVFGLGTWYMGGGMTSDTTTDKKDIAGIKNAIDEGITLIDTAELYGAGHAEELVGEAIKDYDRSKLFIVSKVYSDNLRYDDVLNSCRQSLKRIGTDYLDLYLIHAPNPDIPLEETMKALDELKGKGLIREIGVSNFNIGRLKEAQNFTKNKIVVNQIHYNLAFQDLQEVVDYCQESDVLITCYRPIEQGVMAKGGIAVIDGICKKYHKTPAQVAINWIISQKNMTTISKTSSRNHLEENLGAVGWQVIDEDIKFLKKEFPEVKLPETVMSLKE